MSIYDDLKKQTYKTILRDALNAARQDVDKREGSILYDALAPLSIITAKAISSLHEIASQGRFQTATGEYLDMCGVDHRCYRLGATGAIWSIHCEPDGGVKFAVGTRLVSASGLGLYYKVILDDSGEHNIQCETLGVIGGSDFGALVTVDENPSYCMKATSIEFQKLIDGGRDSDSDDVFRARIWSAINSRRYGGNFDDYKAWILDDFTSSSGGYALDGFQIYSPVSGGDIVIIPTNNGFIPSNGLICDALREFLDHRANGYGAGIVPMCHRISVPSTSIPLVINADIKLILKDNASSDSALKSSVYQAFKDYLSEIRSSGVTVSTSGFPFGGYEVKYFNVSAITNIRNINPSLIQSVAIYESGTTTSFVDMVWASSKTGAVLPVAGQIKVDGVLVS